MVFIPEMVPESKFADYSFLILKAFAFVWLLCPLPRVLIDNNLAISVLAWIRLISWCWMIQYKQTVVELIFTWHFITNRVFMGVLM